MLIDINSNGCLKASEALNWFDLKKYDALKGHAQCGVSFNGAWDFPEFLSVGAVIYTWSTSMDVQIFRILFTYLQECLEKLLLFASK